MYPAADFLPHGPVAIDEKQKKRNEQAGGQYEGGPNEPARFLIGHGEQPFNDQAFQGNARKRKRDEGELVEPSAPPQQGDQGDDQRAEGQGGQGDREKPPGGPA